MKGHNKLVVIAIFLALATMCFIDSICKLYAAEQNKRPKIVVIRDTTDQGASIAKEAVFINKKGKIIKTVPIEKIEVNSSKDFALQHLRYKDNKNIKSGKLFYSFKKTLLNVAGKEKWAKTYTTYTVSASPDVIDHHISFGIADSAGISFVSFRDSMGLYHLEVIDTMGIVIYEDSNKYWYREVQLSPDASILRAYTYDINNTELIVLFDMKSKSKKIITARSIEWTIDACPRNNRMVAITGYKGAKRIILNRQFDSFNEDIIKEY
jgi:hypothetical protein